MELANTLVFVAGWTLSLLLGYVLVRERRSPASTTAWLALVLAFPYVGALIYLMIGTRKRGGRLRRQLRTPKGLVPAPAIEHGARSVEEFIARMGMPPATDNVLRVHVEAGAARRELLALIDGAQSELTFLVYDFQRDSSGAEVLAAIERAATRGVTVRMLVDDLGSWSLSDTHLARMQRRGVHFRRFKPLLQILRARMANLRNHRKIVVADNSRAWTGGRNIGDNYLSDHAEQSRWADLSLTVEGPAAAVLDEIALSDWQFATEDSVAVVAAAPPPEDRPLNRVQVIASGPDRRDDVWHAALLKALMDARHRIHIATPYFVPDEAILQALCIAARCGVDVRILIPQSSDNAIVDLVSMSYVHELARQGAQILRYKSGMLHTKLTLIDELAIVGSANMDSRSFFLNYESLLFCYDGPVVAELSSHYSKLEARSHRGVRTRPAWREALAGFARVLAPML